MFTDTFPRQIVRGPILRIGKLMVPWSKLRAKKRYKIRSQRLRELKKRLRELNEKDKEKHAPLYKILKIMPSVLESVLMFRLAKQY